MDDETYREFVRRKFAAHSNAYALFEAVFYEAAVLDRPPRSMWCEPMGPGYVLLHVDGCDSAGLAQLYARLWNQIPAWFCLAIVGD